MGKLFTHDLSSILKDGEVGEFKLKHFTITNNDFRAVIRNGITPNKEYVVLSHNGTVTMSNTQMEKWSNRNIIRHAKGNVLIAGLGIGMILLEIQDNPHVTSITVVEKSKDVIELVGSQLPLNDKVKIVNEDIFDYLANVPSGTEYDTIYFDIWDCVGEEEREQMSELEEIGEELLSKHGYMDSWSKDIYDYNLDHPSHWVGFDD